MASILDQIREAVSPEVVRSVSTLIGDNPTATGQGFAAAIPTILSGVAETASTPAGAQRVRSLVTEGGYGASTIETLLGAVGGGAMSASLMAGGRQLLSGLFGSKQDDMADAVAKSTHLSGSSARSLLSIAAPIVMSVLGREISTRGLDAGGLMSLLTGQRASIASAVPSALAGILGLRGNAEAERIRHEPARPPAYRDVEPARGRPAWLLPVVAAGLVAVALALFGLLPWGREVTTQTTAPYASPRQLSSLTLPTGEKISVTAGSFLQQFNTFLSSKGDTSVSRRFVFDDLTFETGSAMLTQPSVETVNALAQTLKAYPSVKIGLEGFTDATGDAVSNKQLSQERAEAIKSRLVQSGIEESRITTAGFGSEKPVASNDTEDGRAKNRRTEVVVLER
jgi:outer membrane protein OmpA-like peptidoglycan-associated protein